MTAGNHTQTQKAGNWVGFCYFCLLNVPIEHNKMSWDKCFGSQILCSTVLDDIFNNMLANMLGPDLRTEIPVDHSDCLTVKITALIISKFAYIVYMLSEQLWEWNIKENNLSCWTSWLKLEYSLLLFISNSSQTLYLPYPMEGTVSWFIFPVKENIKVIFDTITTSNKYAWQIHQSYAHLHGSKRQWIQEKLLLSKQAQDCATNAAF